jgi:phosphatidate cytidylyltransferase
MKDSNLAKRMIFVAWAIPLGWWVINSTLAIIPHSITHLLFGPAKQLLLPGHLCTMIIITIGLGEYIRMLSIAFPKNGFWMVYFYLFYQFASYFIPAIALSNKLDIYILLVIVAAESAFWGRYTERWKRASLLFSGVIFLSIAAFSIFNLYHGSLQTIFPRRFASPMLSQLGIVTICAGVFMCDSAAYFIGRAFGKHHFSKISPKKTIEGSIAGFITALVVCTAGWYFFADTTRYPLLLGVAMGILVGVFAQLGDLLVSLIKRYFQVKDASNIIPGHGGVLDRFDSIFFTAPVLNLFFMIITKLAE